MLMDLTACGRDKKIAKEGYRYRFFRRYNRASNQGCQGKLPGREDT